MEKKGYETLLAREAFYEKKLQQAHKRSVEIIIKAQKEAQGRADKVLAQGHNQLNQERALLAGQHNDALALLDKQTEAYRKATSRKESQLTPLAQTLAKDLLKEWDAAL